MSPADFKSRFISTLPEIPAEIGLRLDEFFVYPEVLVNHLAIPRTDKDILTVSGLPKDAAPFLTFGMGKGDCLRRLGEAYGLSQEFGRYRMIGSNSSGDMICIDEARDGMIVYLNHDNNMQVIYMNSGVCSLASSLCAFGKLMLDGDAAACRAAIHEVDPKAIEPGNFWAAEIDNEEIDRRTRA